MYANKKAVLISTNSIAPERKATKVLLKRFGSANSKLFVTLNTNNRGPKAPSSSISFNSIKESTIFESKSAQFIEMVVIFCSIVNRMDFTDLALDRVFSMKIGYEEGAVILMNETPIVLGGVICDSKSYTTTPHRFLIRSLFPTNPEHF